MITLICGIWEGIKRSKPELVDTENILAVARVGVKRWGVTQQGWVGEMGEDGQKIQTSSFKINKSWGCKVQSW